MIYSCNTSSVRRENKERDLVWIYDNLGRSCNIAYRSAFASLYTYVYGSARRIKQTWRCFISASTDVVRQIYRLVARKFNITLKPRKWFKLIKFQSLDPTGSATEGASCFRLLKSNFESRPGQGCIRFPVPCRTVKAKTAMDRSIAKGVLRNQKPWIIRLRRPPKVSNNKMFQERHAFVFAP